MIRVLSALAIGLAAASASAQDVPGCAAPIQAWAAACDAGGPVHAVSCPVGRAVFSVGALEVEVSRDPAHAFAAAGELGASPIGEFPDWGAVPAADRAAFDALVGCLRARPAELVAALDPHPAPATLRPPLRSGTRSAAPSSAPPVPWRLLLGLALAVGLLVRRFGAAELARRAAPPLGLALATFALRRLLLPERFFHQNGHGATWVEYALGRATPYGPGFEELFGVARLAGDADGAVFLLMGALGALVPPAIFALARGVGARRELAWAAALVVALAPLPARLSASESYFAVALALNALAAAILALGVRPDAPRTEAALAAAAAGLLVAQSARVHPVLWLSAALLPFVLVVVRGPIRERLRLVLLATSVVAAVVLVAAAPAMLDVLSGELGAAWLGPAGRADGRAMPGWMPIALAVIALGALVRGPRRPLGHAAALFAASAALAWRGDILGAAPPWVHEAHAWLYLPPIAAAVVGLAPQDAAEAGPRGVTEGTQRAIAAGVFVLAALGLVLTAGPALTIPTDAREAALVRSWRGALPPGAVVAHVERAERQILTLPLRGFADVPVVCGTPAPDLLGLGDDVFIYRAGLCSTERGRACCEALEAPYVLQPFATASLPPVSSMTGLDFDVERVEVGLYRVRGPAGGPSTDARSRGGRDGR